VVAALVVVVVHGPYQLLSSLALSQLLPDLLDPTLFDPFSEELPDTDLLVQWTTWGGVLSIIGLLVGVITSAAVVAAVLQRDRGEVARVGSVLAASASRSGATIGASVLTVLAAGVAFVVLAAVIVPLAVLVPPLGVIAGLSSVAVLTVVVIAVSSLVIPVAMVEGRGAWTTFMRTLWIVRHRFARVLGVTLLAGLVVLLVTGAISTALGLLSLLAGPFSWVVDGFNGTLVAVVSTPVSAYVALLIYLDARVRLEGLDLTVRARELGPS